MTHYHELSKQRRKLKKWATAKIKKRSNIKTNASTPNEIIKTNCKTSNMERECWKTHQFYRKHSTEIVIKMTEHHTLIPSIIKSTRFPLVHSRWMTIVNVSFRLLATVSILSVNWLVNLRARHFPNINKTAATWTTEIGGKRHAVRPDQGKWTSFSLVG